MPWDAAMLLTLWLLLLGHVLLIRGCFGIKDALHPAGADLRIGLDDVTDHLRESVEVLSYIAEGLPGGASSQTGMPSGEGLLATLLGSILMPDHASAQQERPIREVVGDPTPPVTS